MRKNRRKKADIRQNDDQGTSPTEALNSDQRSHDASRIGGKQKQG